MALQQSIDLALDANIGAGGLPQTAVDAALGLVGEAMKRLAEDDASGRLPLLHMPRTTDDLASIREAAAFLRNDATDVVFLGTGGSSLGGQTLAQLEGLRGAGRRSLRREPAHPLPRQSRPASPSTASCTSCRSPRPAFVSISKSGGTGETLMQTIAVLSALEKAGLRARADDLFLGISEPRRDGRQERACAIFSSPRACASSSITPASAGAIRC